MAGFDVADGQLAAAHAGEPVAQLVLAMIQADGVGGEQFLGDVSAFVRVFGFELVAEPEV